MHNIWLLLRVAPRMPESHGPKVVGFRVWGFRIPGVQLLEIPYDPTTLSNEHDERINALDSQIAEKAGAEEL